MSTDQNPVRRAALRIVLLLGATVTTLVACTAQAGVPTPADLGSPGIPAPAVPAPADSVSKTLAADFAAMQDDLHGTVGIALMPVDGRQVTTLGSWTTGVAWSTIKVPLALAALRQDSTGLADSAAAAITASDNEAAQAMWDALGGGEQAANAVEAVLRETGDTSTDVADRHNPAAKETVNDQMSFGATVWTLVDQVRFASRLPCLDHATPVMDLMSQITSSQSWGLGSFTGAEFKGGWGPDDDTGNYLVRQFGLLPTWAGQVAVAIAAQPDSGTFDDATAMLDKVSALLARHARELGGGRCTR
ncbi:hypothetical protein [Nocardia sp. alder85J]|uniref:hypothetical protein n=1 Tax=Nocardia sp. alder85J TaxID=2862949 RepID=UPI001CD3225B|nr:hypothetical protein [Nocardia sp. alder85J]MCX4093936.1 hypothetical protein [Nocardia sp. alder85J]